ncbi:MAG: hypothetical protein ACFFC7_26480 [Candidatus Hermodarchaeota archaeon]
MRIIAIGILIAVIFGVGFTFGVIYNTYVEPEEEESLNVKLYNNLELVEIEFENVTWLFDGNPSDYNLTGDPEKDAALKLRFCNLTVIEQEEPIYILIVTELLVREPYQVWWDKYTLKVTFQDYTTQTSHVGRTGLYFYAFYRLYLIE